MFRVGFLSSRFASSSGRQGVMQTCACGSASEHRFVPEPRPNEPLSAKRARLLYQSKKRGILENDLLLGGFAQSHLKSLSEDQLAKYDLLINGGHNEWDIYYWIVDAKPVPNEIKSDVFDKLKEYSWNEGKVFWYKAKSLKKPGDGPPQDVS